MKDTVDITLTWEDLIPTFVFILQRSENPSGAIEELRRMAKLADLYVESQKAQKEADRL